MKYRERLTSDPKIMLGKLVIRGTRIPAALVLKKLSVGLSIEELLKGYPNITREDVLACLEYSADVVSKEEIIAP